MKISRIILVAFTVILTMTSCVEINATSAEVTTAEVSENTAVEPVRYAAVSNPIRVNTYDSSDIENGGDIFQWRGYEYNADGSVRKMTQHDGAVGLLMSWEEYEYDSSGNKTKTSFYSGPGSFMGEGEYSEENALTGWTTFEYDDKGRLAKEVHSSDGEVVYWYEYVY